MVEYNGMSKVRHGCVQWCEYNGEAPSVCELWPGGVVSHREWSLAMLCKYKYKHKYAQIIWSQIYTCNYKYVFMSQKEVACNAKLCFCQFGKNCICKCKDCRRCFCPQVLKQSSGPDKERRKRVVDKMVPLLQQLHRENMQTQRYGYMWTWTKRNHPAYKWDHRPLFTGGWLRLWNPVREGFK